MEINRLKLALVERKKTNKWLAEKINKGESTVSLWCTNSRQPSLETLFSISQVLNIDIRELLISTKSI